MHGAGGAPSIEQLVAGGRQHPFEAIVKSDDAPSPTRRGADDSTQNGVEAGAVAATGKNSDLLAHVSAPYRPFRAMRSSELSCLRAVDQFCHLAVRSGAQIERALV